MIINGLEKFKARLLKKKLRKRLPKIKKQKATKIVKKQIRYSSKVLKLAQDVMLNKNLKINTEICDVVEFVTKIVIKERKIKFTANQISALVNKEIGQCPTAFLFNSIDEDAYGYQSLSNYLRDR